jgi:iron complex transport system substrate-binding protein
MLTRFFLLILILPIWVYACEVTDDCGHQIKLAAPAHHIISLAPDLTEMLFAAGAGNSIVGVIDRSDYPPRAKKIPRVASYNTVDVEKVAALQPDLIVVWAEGNLAEPLKKLGVPIYYSYPQKLTDLPRTLKNLGCLAGTENIANTAADNFIKHYSKLKKKYERKRKVLVFYQVWPQPLITISKNSWINDVINLCGGKNIFANLKGAAPEINLEAVLVANPEIIIGTEGKQDWKSTWGKWPGLSAVKNKKLIAIDPDLIERASLRLLEGAEKMCSAIDQAR